MPGIITSRTRILYQRMPTGPFCVNAASPQAFGLSAWWPCNEGSGKTAFNQSLREIQGSNVASPAGLTLLGATWGPAPVVGGNCLRFVRASSQYAEEESTSSSGIGSAPWSWSCWFYSTLASTQQDLLSTDTGSVTGNVLRLTSGNAVAHMNRTQTATATGTVTQNEWCLATGITVASNSRRAYRNGSNEGTQGSFTTLGVPTPLMLGRSFIGSGNYGNYFDGYIMDVRFYNAIVSKAVMTEMFDWKTRWQLYYQLGRVSYSFAEADAATGHPAVRRFSQCAGYRPTAIGVEGVTIG